MKKILLVISLLLLIVIIYLLYIFNYIGHKKYDNNDFDIETYTSTVDKDNDGIDDQSDILESVRDYVSTNPKYESRYYNGGYPDDGYGVCTDVVSFGLLEAGYNLRDLVNEDIISNMDLYDIEKVDKNIDFRRVRNLDIYFKNNSINLTTDIYDINSWQGGDIIVFKKHIGIVSDKRNKKGIPFIIHHYSKYQKEYEEDILEYRNDIIGHYRIS